MLRGADVVRVGVVAIGCGVQWIRVLVIGGCGCGAGSLDPRAPVSWVCVAQCCGSGGACCGGGRGGESDPLCGRRVMNVGSGMSGLSCLVGVVVGVGWVVTGSVSGSPWNVGGVCGSGMLTTLMVSLRRALVHARLRMLSRLVTSGGYCSALHSGQLHGCGGGSSRT